MLLVVGFKEGHPLKDPLPERPLTIRQFTQPDERPTVDLDAALSPPLWNVVSDIGLLGKLSLEIREFMYEAALVRTLSAVDARIQKLVEEHGAVSTGTL